MVLVNQWKKFALLHVGQMNSGTFVAMHAPKDTAATLMIKVTAKIKIVLKSVNQDANVSKDMHVIIKPVSASLKPNVSTVHGALITNILSIASTLVMRDNVVHGFATTMVCLATKIFMDQDVGAITGSFVITSLASVSQKKNAGFKCAKMMIHLPCGSRTIAKVKFTAAMEISVDSRDQSLCPIMKVTRPLVSLDALVSPDLPGTQTMDTNVSPLTNALTQTP